MSSILRTVITLVAATTGFVQAATPTPAVPESAVEIGTTKPRFSMSAGILFRNISGDFRMSATPPLPVLSGREGRGDVGLYHLGYGTVTYDDGSLGPGYGYGDGHTPDGTAYGVINSPSQISNPRQTSEGEGSVILYRLSFHSHDSYNTSTYQPGGFASSDNATGVGPYLNLSYSVIQLPHAEVNLTLGYSWVGASLESGQGLLASQTVRQFNDFYTYQYDHDASSSGVLKGPFPFNDKDSYTIVDAGLSNSKPNGYTSYSRAALPPTKSSSHSSSLVAVYQSLGESHVHVNLHELVLAPEISVTLWDRLHAALSVGPTLNFINTDFSAHAAWYQNGRSAPIRSYHWNDSSLDTQLGIATQLMLRYDLTSRLFLEAGASYRYVPKTTVTAGPASVTLDLSSWVASIGVGYRL